jgi:hypothetical protein
MKVKKKMLLFFGAFLLCVLVINQFVFPLPFTCYCINEENAQWKCNYVCGGPSECEGFTYNMWGICSSGDCFFSGYILCNDLDPVQTVFVTLNCETCFGGW